MTLVAINTRNLWLKCSKWQRGEREEKKERHNLRESLSLSQTHVKGNKTNLVSNICPLSLPSSNKWSIRWSRGHIFRNRHNLDGQDSSSTDAYLLIVVGKLYFHASSPCQYRFLPDRLFIPKIRSQHYFSRVNKLKGILYVVYKKIRGRRGLWKDWVLNLH